MFDTPLAIGFLLLAGIGLLNDADPAIVMGGVLGALIVTRTSWNER